MFDLRLYGRFILFGTLAVVGAMLFSTLSEMAVVTASTLFK